VYGSTGRHEVAGGGLPADPDLPALAAIAQSGLEAVFEQAGLAGATDARLLKHHPGARCTFRVATAGGPVAAKAYADDIAPVLAAHAFLAEHGLASGRAPTAAPVAAADVELRLVVMRWWDAPCGVDLIAAGAGERAGELAAAWLRRAARAPAPGAAPVTTEAALRFARSRAHILARLDARLGEEARAVAARLAERPPPGRPSALVHGSLYAAHIFDLGDGPGIIDCDRLGAAPLELDAGMFEATVARLALDGALAAEAAAAVAAFRAGLAGLIDERAVAWHRAASLLTLARRVAGRREGDWIRDAGSLLAAAGPAA